MNPNEYKFYRILSQFMDPEYLILSQVHLDELVNVLYSNQEYRLFSLRHIIQKSVDFVICNKITMHPLLAIELDGASHKRNPSLTRDPEVERILTEAKIPLKRFKDSKHLDVVQIEKEVREMLQKI